MDLAERRRLEGLQVLAALEDDPHPSLDRVVRLAAAITGAPNAAIHVIDAVSQHRVAAVNAPLGTTPRQDSLCRLVIESGEAIATDDATGDDRFGCSSFVTGDDPVRFYASSPLDTEAYGPLGTLCVWDIRSRSDPEEVLLNLADLAAMVIDNLEASRALRLLAEAAATDVLTQLPNRRLIHDTITRSLAAADRQDADSGLVVAYLDLDGFKPINDTHGHDVGDAVLAGVADNLRSLVRADEMVGRIGGDEFVVVGLADLADPEAVQRIRAAVARPVATPAGPLAVGASVGAVTARPGDTADSLLRRADQKMFEAKRAGARP